MKRRTGKSFFHYLITATGRMICLIHVLSRIFPWRRKHVTVFKTDRIGDMLLFLPYMRKLHDWYSERNCRVTIVIRPENLELVRRAEIADRIEIYPRYENSLQWTGFRLGFWLRNGIDIAVNASCIENEVIGAYRLEKLVTVRLGDRKTGPDAIDVSEMSIREWNESLLAALGIEGTVSPFDYDRFCDPVKAEWAEKPYILVCAEASDLRRSWEEEKFAELIGRLSSEYKRKIMLVGTDRAHGEEILKQCGSAPDVVNLCGKTTLFELFTLIREADFLITNDTSSAHIGALIGTKTFIICGKGDYGIFVPYSQDLEGQQVFSIFSDFDCRGCHWRNPRKECLEAKTYRCISEISVGLVWEVLREQEV